MIQKVKSGYKAVTVFLVGFAGFLGTTLADQDVQAALPDGPEKWLIVVGVPGILAAAAWLKRNEPTIEEAQKALDRATARGI